MHQRKSKKFLVYFFLLIIVSTINNNSINKLKFKNIQNINVTGLNEKDNQKIVNEIKSLNLENIFFINKSKINGLIKTNSLIESYEIFKEYPSTISIKIKKTNYYAKINYNGETFLIGSNGKLNSNNSNYGHLPYIFGKPDIDEFLKFKRIIDKSEFSFERIENLFFFPSKRWDLKLKDDILLRLPTNVTNERLDNIHQLLENFNGESFNIVDARIENQIILNE